MVQDRDSLRVEKRTANDYTSSRKPSRRASGDATGSFILVLAACFAIWTKLHWGPQTLDDAYITLRYVANLLSGSGFVYNYGEHVLGTTSPLYTLILWMTAVGSGDRNLPSLAFLVNLVADAINLLLVVALSRELGASRIVATLAALAHALSASFAYYSCGGMETAIFELWLLAAFNAFLRGRLVVAFTCASLATLTRPEGLLLFFVFGVVETVQYRRVLWQAFAGGFPLVCWGAFAWAYFGSPIPHSVLAKIAPIYAPQPPFAIFWMLARHLAGVVDATLLPIRIAGDLAPTVACIVLAAATAVVMRSSHSARAWAVPLFVALFWASYSIANRILAEWYPVPLEPLYVILLLAGVAISLQAVSARIEVEPGGGILIALVIVLLMVPARLREFKFAATPYSSQLWFTPEGFWPLEGRETVYREAAGLLDPVTSPQTLIALSEIGTFGYFSHSRILDTVGLVSPVALRYYPLASELRATNNAVPPDLIRDLAPDYVASLEIFVRASLLKATWFREEYELILRLPTSYFGSREFLVFRRKSLRGPSLSRRR